MTVTYKTQKVGPVDVFYREAGPKDPPVILLLHGYRTTSHMFRSLIPQLAARYRVIAPDLPGFGLTKVPPRGQFDYTFANLTGTMEGFTEALGLTRYALYVFDYGAPTGFRLAAAHPERVTAIMSQNGNAYAEGLSGAWSPYQAYWRHPSDATRNACRAALTPEAIRTQYVTGADPARVSPDGYTLDIAYFARPGTDEIQFDLIYGRRARSQAPSCRIAGVRFSRSRRARSKGSMRKAAPWSRSNCRMARGSGPTTLTSTSGCRSRLGVM